jgi:anti-sigma-K factor RskA
MTHDVAQELLAAFALDAVEPHESDLVEMHLAHCPRCRSEYDALKEVASALGNSVEPLPEHLWSRISSRLPQRNVEQSPPMPRLLRRDSDEDNLTPITPLRQRPAKKWMAVTGAIVSAAAVSAVLGLSLVRDGSSASSGQALGRSETSDVVAALETPGHHVVNLEGADHVKLAQFVVANGRGFLVSSSLPTLSAGETYQLWGLIANEPISLGLLGRSPSQSVFTLAGSSSPTQLSVTVEPADGSVVPTSQMLATGTI